MVLHANFVHYLHTILIFTNVKTDFIKEGLLDANNLKPDFTFFEGVGKRLSGKIGILFLNY